MHATAQFIAEAFSPLSDFATMLASTFGRLACNAGSGSFLLAAFVVASVVLAAGTSTWAILERFHSSKRLARTRLTLQRSQRAVQVRNALLRSLPVSALVLRPKGKPALSFRRGGEIFRHCLAGPDAPRLANAVNALLTEGTGFALTVRTLGLRDVALRGQPLGDSYAIFLHDGFEANAPGLFTRALAAAKPTVEIAGATAVAARPASVEPTRSIPAPNERPLATATLHTLPESAIVIGSDGRLKQYNAAFAKQWQLDTDSLGRAPHMTELATTAIAKFGDDAIWDAVTAAAASPEPERLGDWGALTRGDGRALSLRMSRLKDGSTRVIFADDGRRGRNAPLIDATGIAA